LSPTIELGQQLVPYQGIIFDLDNTIFLQTTFDHSAFLEISDYLASKYQLKQKELFSFFVIHRNSPPPYKNDLFGCCCREFNIPLNESPYMVTLFRQHKLKELTLAPEYRVLLTHLSQQKKTLLLVTNGIQSVQQEKISKLKLAAYFKEMLVCTADGDIPLKPDPAAFSYLKKRHTCSSWVMVGDLQETDGLFAKNSGIDFIQHKYCGGG